MTSVGALVVAVVIVGVYMSAIGAKSPARVTLASPTTVVPVVLAVGVLAVAGFIVSVMMDSGAEIGTVLIALLVVIAIGMRIAGSTAGTRVVIERGATTWPTGEVIGAIVLGFFIWLIAVG